MHRSKLRHTRENIRCKREVGQFDLDLKPKFTTKYTFSHNLPNPITFFSEETEFGLFYTEN